MTINLTDAQLVMLSAAAQREDHCLTAPDKLKGAILAKVGEKLVKLGLVREVRTKAGMPVWRRDDAGNFALKLTAAGLKAIAVEDDSDQAGAPREAPQCKPHGTQDWGHDAIGDQAKAPTPRAGSKLAQVIDLLKRSDGATIANLVDATGWLPHTTRAALTGLRKRGYAVARERVEGGDSIYGIVDQQNDSMDDAAAAAGEPEGAGRGPKLKANQAA
jgi:hypothetical protein